MKNLHSPRRFFTNLRDAVELPNLIEVQKDSYQWFLKEGLRELFDEISPLKDFTGRDLELYFEDKLKEMIYAQYHYSKILSSPATNSGGNNNILANIRVK